jgi:hypothetical protein
MAAYAGTASRWLATIIIVISFSIFSEVKPASAQVVRGEKCNNHIDNNNNKRSLYFCAFVYVYPGSGNLHQGLVTLYVGSQNTTAKRCKLTITHRLRRSPTNTWNGPSTSADCTKVLERDGRDYEFLFFGADTKTYAIEAQIKACYYFYYKSSTTPGLSDCVITPWASVVY